MKQVKKLHHEIYGPAETKAVFESDEHKAMVEDSLKEKKDETAKPTKPAGTSEEPFRGGPGTI